jgi:hypothetical protein
MPKKSSLSAKSRLAGYHHGKIWVSPLIKRKADRKRVLIHEKTELKDREMTGDSYTKAHNKALKAEMKGMTKHQKEVYSGRLGAIARRSKKR